MRILLAVFMAAALIAPTTVGWGTARVRASARAAVESPTLGDESSQRPASQSPGCPGDPERDEGEESSASEEDSSDSKFTGPIQPGDAAFPSPERLPLMGSLVGLGPRLGHETELERPPRA